MGMPEPLYKLVTAAGPSGYEQAPAAVFREAAGAFAEVTYDTVGSTVARVPGTGEGRSVAIVGHIDEIGLIVHHIDDDGFLWFTGVGGWDPVVLVGQRVAISTRSGVVVGVVGKKPIHLMKDDDRKHVPQLKDLHIDIGAKDGEEARRLVRIGDVAVIDAEPLEFPNNRFVSRSMDNRIGCYVALEAARIVAEAGGARGDVYALAVAQEEITFGGARTTAFSLQPDVAIAVDVTFATDQPGLSEQELGRHHFGGGPVLTRGSIVSPVVFRMLSDTATRLQMPFTVQAAGRETSTDADFIHLAREGIPTGLVSVPNRYMHSAVEMVQLDDIVNAARLIAEFALRLAPDTDFRR
jgi:endoglucanase